MVQNPSGKIELLREGARNHRPVGLGNLEILVQVPLGVLEGIRDGDSRRGWEGRRTELSTNKQVGSQHLGVYS